MKCAVVGCGRKDGLRIVLIPFGDLQIEAHICYPCEIQIDEKHAHMLGAPEVIYSSPSDDRAVTEKATKNVKPTGVEDKNVQEGAFDEEE